MTKAGMLSSELEEKKRHFLQEIYYELVQCVREHSLLFSKVPMHKEEEWRILQKIQNEPVRYVREQRSLFGLFCRPTIALVLPTEVCS